MNLSKIERVILFLGAVAVISGTIFLLMMWDEISSAIDVKDQEPSEDLLNESFINGTIAGANLVIFQIAEIAVQCEIIPLTVGNVTMTLFALECLEEVEG